MRYLRRKLNYQERIILSDSTHMMSMTYLVATGVETLRIDSGRSLEKEFTDLIGIIHELYDTKLLVRLIISRLCMLSFDIRYQRHLVDG